MNTLLKALVSCVFGLMAISRTSAIPASSLGSTSGITTNSTQDPNLTDDPAPVADAPVSSDNATGNSTSIPVRAVNNSSGAGGASSQQAPLPIGLANTSDLGATNSPEASALSTNATANSTGGLPVNSVNSTSLDGTVSTLTTPTDNLPVNQTSLASTAASATPASANENLAVQTSPPSPTEANGTVANQVTPPAAVSVSNTSLADADSTKALPMGNSTADPLNITSQVGNPPSGPSNNNSVSVNNVTIADPAPKSGGLASN